MYEHRDKGDRTPHRCHACQICGKILGWCKCFKIENAEVEFNGTCGDCIDERNPLR